MPLFCLVTFSFEMLALAIQAGLRQTYERKKNQTSRCMLDGPIVYVDSLLLSLIQYFLEEGKGKTFSKDFLFLAC